MECHLTSESGLVSHSTASGISASRAADDHETFEFYEKICLKGDIVLQAEIRNMSIEKLDCDQCCTILVTAKLECVLFVGELLYHNH